MKEAGAKGKTKRKGGQTGGKETRDEDRKRTRRRGSRKEAPKVVSCCIWAAGRRVRWRVLGLIIETAEIRLFVCDPRKCSF